jgi:hypothetical protein
MATAFLLRLFAVNDKIPADLLAQQATEALLVLSFAAVRFSDTVANGLLSFLLWYERNGAFPALDALVETPEPEENLQFVADPKEYNQTHLQQTFSKQSETRPWLTVVSLVGKLIAPMEKCAGFYKLLGAFAGEFRDVSLILLLSSWLGIVKELGVSSWSFLKRIIVSHLCYNGGELSGRFVRLHEVTCELLCLLFAGHPQWRMEILNTWASIEAPQHFLRALPMLRSLLSSAKEVSFLQHFFTSRILSVIASHLEEDEWQRVTDGYVAYLQQVVIAQPAAALEPFVTLQILAKCARQPRYVSIVVPCFGIGLKLGSQSDWVVTQAIRQVADLLLAAVSTPSLQEAAALMVRVVADSLRSISTDKLTHSEMQVILGEIPKLPLLTQKKETMAAVLTFISV